MTPTRRMCLALLLSAGCATFAGPAGTFAVQCNVAQASVLIDDVFVGRASEWAPPGRAIRPGFHLVEIRHPSYFAHYAEIQLAEGGAATIKAELRPLLD